MREKKTDSSCQKVHSKIRMSLRKKSRKRRGRRKKREREKGDYKNQGRPTAGTLIIFDLTVVQATFLMVKRRG